MNKYIQNKIIELFDMGIRISDISKNSKNLFKKNISVKEINNLVISNFRDPNMNEYDYIPEPLDEEDIKLINEIKSKLEREKNTNGI